MMKLDEGVLSWCFIRVLECLARNPPDVPDAQSYALDGVNYIIGDKRPPRYESGTR